MNLRLNISQQFLLLISGSFDYSMGTHCFFSQSNRPGSGEDACFNELPDKIYEYLAKTDKVLKMRRIFVEEKESETNSELVEGEIEDLEHLRITKTYAEALNQFLKPGEQPPREIIQESESDDEEEEENKMEVENIEEMPIILQQPDQQLDEELPDEEPSESQSETQSDTRTEDSENTKNAKIEAVVQQEFEKLTDPSQFS